MRNNLPLLLLLGLVACAAEPQAATPPAAAPAQAQAAAPQQAEEAPAPTTVQGGVDATRLPEDVQQFILNQRMCRHFNRPVDEGGNSTMAGITCPKADDAAWKALLRKYQTDADISSVLLAERPEGSRIEE